MCVQAQATQEANRAASNKWPPFWAIAAMVVLGFDEFVAVLYNPLWLVLALIIFLFGKTVYQVRLLSSSVLWQNSHAQHALRACRLCVSQTIYSLSSMYSMLQAITPGHGRAVPSLSYIVSGLPESSEPC